MSSEANLNIAVLPGDGIGVDVINAALPVIDALGIPATLCIGDIGWSFWEQEGNPIPDRTWQLIEKSDVILLGATTSKPQKEARDALSEKFNKNNPHYLSPIIQLRQQLDLFANVRPCFNIQSEKAFNLCIIRENTEGLYAGFDYHPLPATLHDFILQNKNWANISQDELSCTLRIQSHKGLTRLFKFAFDYADKHNMRRVTLADKPNVLRYSSAFARELFEEQARQYPRIKADILNVDAVALWLIKRPEEFGVIIAENMFGDILSDVAAGVMGGLGFAPSANIGQTKSYFEPVHGSGPRMKHQSANPAAMFLTISMMLAHLDFKKEADIIKQSVIAIVKEGNFLTYDVGGNASTAEMATAIINRCLQLKSGHQRIPDELPWQRLSAFSSAELSDALDACQIEGALLGIKPLAMGKKLIGPAYTIEYSSYTNENQAVTTHAPQTYQNAANYIDAVPMNSVIVIDNQGREDCTVWGDILTQVALQKKINGTVVNGSVRDVELIRSSQYPVYCKNYYMRTGKNRVYKSSEQVPITINNVIINPGDIIFADDNGVLVIPLFKLDEIIAKALNIKNTEANIIAAVKTGATLMQARSDYSYHMPWLAKPKDQNDFESPERLQTD